METIFDTTPYLPPAIWLRRYLTVKNPGKRPPIHEMEVRFCCRFVVVRYQPLLFWFADAYQGYGATPEQLDCG
jgi:hypothetical protein